MILTDPLQLKGFYDSLISKPAKRKPFILLHFHNWSRSKQQHAFSMWPWAYVSKVVPAPKYTNFPIWTTWIIRGTVGKWSHGKRRKQLSKSHYRTTKSATTTTLVTSSLRHLTHLVPPRSYIKQLFGPYLCLTFTKMAWLCLPGPQDLPHKAQQAALLQGRVGKDTNVPSFMLWACL